jgi:hypothetical protein
MAQTVGYQGSYAAYAVGSSDMRYYGPAINNAASSLINRTASW